MKRLIVLLMATILCSLSFAQKPQRVIKKLGSEPVFFVDSINVSKDDLNNYDPNQIAAVTVFKGKEAVEFLGDDGKDGAVYIETKAFARTRYWTYFSSKSPEYLKVVPAAGSDSAVQYILNGKVLKENFEGNLSSIDDKVFKELKVINKETLQKEFGINDKEYGIVIASGVPDNLYRGKEKF